MAYGPYYDPDNKVVYDGNVVQASDINDISSSVDTAFELVAADLELLEPQGATTPLQSLTPSADKIAYYTGAATAALTTLTSQGRALIDDTTASAQRTTLGLGNVPNVDCTNADNITSGTLADARIASTITRDSEVNTATQAALDLKKNLYEYDFEDYGVCDGITDDATALSNLITTIAATLSTDAADSVSAVLRCSSDFVINSPITFPAKQRFIVKFDCTVSVGTWTGLSSAYAFTFNWHNSQFHLNKLDCGGQCCGFINQGYGNVYKVNRVHHWTDVGFCHGGNSGAVGNCLYEGIFSHQWLTGDGEDFANHAAWTGKACKVTGSDSKFINCNLAWCEVPLYLDTTAGVNWFYGCHIWNGVPSAYQQGYPYGKPTDPTIIENHATAARNYIVNSYLDNGLIHQYEPSLQIINCNHFYLTDNVTLTHPYERYYKGGYGGSSDPYVANNKGTKISVGFYANPDDALDVWGGDYASINNATILSEQYTDGNETEIYKRKHIIKNTDDVLYFNKYFTPGGNLSFSYTVGAANPQTVTFNGSETKFEAPAYRFTNLSPGTVPHPLYLGGGVVGISEETAGELYLGSSEGFVWKVGSGGNLKPTVTDTYDIGAPTEAVQNIYTGSVFCSSLTGGGEAFIRGNLDYNATLFFREATTNGGTTYDERGSIGYDATNNRSFWRHQAPTGPLWTSGSGSPEGAVTGPIGSLYTRTDGGANTTLYVKESGTGNTGWVAK